MSQAKTSTFPGRLIVHLGDHKTGSTTIQAALARGDVRLRQGRLAYPLLKDRFNQNHLAVSLGRRGVDLRRFRLPFGQSNKGFAVLARRAAMADPDVTILSAENFEGVRPQDLDRALRRHFPVPEDRRMLIAYLRPHAGRAISSLAERIKIGHARANPWDGFMLMVRTRLRYAARVAQWEAVFGSRYRLRLMLPSELRNGSILEDFFFETLGDGAVEIGPSPRVNESLPVEDLMRLHVMHQALPRLDKGQHLVLGWALSFDLAKSRAPDAAGTRLRLHKALAEAILQACRADARKIDQTVAGGRPLLVEDLERVADTAPRDPLSLDPADWLSPDEIRDLRARAQALAPRGNARKWQNELRAQRLAHILGR